MFDLIVRGGLVVDGAGGAPVVADVGVRAGRIAAVGPELSPGGSEIDATGQIVTPASSTSTPTTTVRPRGTRSWRRRPHTASPPS